MESRVILSWQARERAAQPKERSWYWAVGIVAVGVAIAAAIIGNYLFSAVAVLAGFSVMLVGSTQPQRHTYRLTEHGVVIGKKLVPFRAISRFAIHEDEPMTLILETGSLSGSISIPLRGVDWRAIEMELKNRNIEEVESLHSIIDHVARGIGLG